MSEIKYGKHKWLTRLIDFCNNRLAKWSRDGREIYPNNLCQLFWATISSVIRTFVAVVLIVSGSIIGLGFAIGFIYCILWPVIQLFYPASDAPSAVLLFFGSGACYIFVGCVVNWYFKEILEYTSVWRKPISEFVKKSPVKNNEKVDKQPSLIIEYLKGIKNKVCPVITY